MSGWDFDSAGKFGSESEAGDFAKRNRIDPRDVRTRPRGDDVELEIRRSAVDQEDLRDPKHQRRKGF